MEGKAPSRASGVEEDSGNTGAGGFAAVRHGKGGEGSRALQRELCRTTRSGVVPKSVVRRLPSRKGVEFSGL